MKTILEQFKQGIAKRTSLVWTVLFLLAFTGVGTIAVRTTILTTQQQDELQRQNTQETLQKFVTVWEEGVISQVQFWNASLGTVEISDVETLERQWKKSTPWLESIIVWENDFIAYPSIASSTIEADCLTSPILWMDCSEESVSVQNKASLLKAQYWIQNNDFERAQFELLSARPALRTTFRNLDLNKEALITFIERRFLLYQTETLGAPLSGGQALLKESIQQAQELHPEIVSAILERLPVLVTPDDQIGATIDRLKRKQTLWNQVEEYLTRDVETEFELIPIMADDTPLLLALFHESTTRTIAISLDVPTLMDTLTTQRTGFQPIITDSNGSIVRPLQYQWQANTTIIQVPGPQLFPQFRITLENPPSESVWSQLVLTLVPIVLSGCLGLIAIYGSWKADQQKIELIHRQQAFIARVTHELKTPLAGIRLMTETLQLDQTEQTQPFIEKILQESTRLEERIDEILQVAKNIEIKKLVRMDTEMLLMELYDTWLPRFQEVSGILRTEYDAVEIIADEMLLKDAIQNLLSNAIKYRHPKRKLRCVLSIRAQGKWLEISLIDNGIGVPSAERKRIFERFVRIEGNHRGLAGGHGLGLAFVAETAKVHQGWIRCTDGLDGGICISLGMPIVAPT